MRALNKATVTRTAFRDRPDRCDSCPQSDNCHEDGGPKINKAIIVTRQVGRRHPTTNQRNIKMFELMMKMVIIIPIIIIIIVGMSMPNTPADPKTQGLTTTRKPEPTPCHRGGGWESQQADPPPDATTPQGGGKEATTTPHHREGAGEPGGGGGRGVGQTGIIHIYIYIYVYVCVYTCI